MPTAKQGLATGALFACFFLVASITTGDSPPPPPRIPCSTDADCEGCLRCAGATATTQGACETATWAGPRCMCDADCAAQGYGRACSVPADKPLCGGECVNQAPSPELVCGAGADVVRLEPFERAVTTVPAAVRVANEAEQLAVETFGVRP